MSGAETCRADTVGRYAHFHQRSFDGFRAPLRKIEIKLQRTCRISVSFYQHTALRILLKKGCELPDSSLPAFLERGFADVEQDVGKGQHQAALRLLRLELTHLLIQFAGSFERYVCLRACDLRLALLGRSFTLSRFQSDLLSLGLTSFDFPLMRPQRGPLFSDGDILLGEVRVVFHLYRIGSLFQKRLAFTQRNLSSIERLSRTRYHG